MRRDRAEHQVDISKSRALERQPTPCSFPSKLNGGLQALLTTGVESFEQIDSPFPTSVAFLTKYWPWLLHLAKQGVPSTQHSGGQLRLLRNQA